MRIDKIYIKEFKNLKEFFIDLDENRLTNVFIGRNGAGKSNLMEAIVIIFRDLDLQEKPIFGYEMQYYCRGYKVKIEADYETNQILFFVNDIKISKKNFYIKNGDDYIYLPKHVFAYYSGPSNRLQKHFDKHQKKFSDALRKGDDKTLRPLFYARLVHSNFVLLAFFSFFEESSKKFLSTYFDLCGVESILFVLKNPYWNSKKKGTFEKGDFWGSRGIVKDFLERLYEFSLAPLSETITIGDEFSKTNSEATYLFIKDEGRLIEFAQYYKSNTEFFKFLESTYISDLIYEIKIKVKKSDGTVITFNELSEGEQQLLSVLGLLKFTKDDESIFLLDEPDTHLNPAWKFEYLNLIKEVVGKSESSQVIISTHDPIVIGGLKKEEVTIFDKKDLGIVTKNPDFDPKGMGVAGLLTSELFGLSSTLDPDTQKQLHRKRQLLYNDNRTLEDEKEMKLIEKELGDLDYTKTIRDPLYEKFIRSLFSRPEYQDKDLTPEDIAEMEKLTDEILDEILEEEKK